MQFEEKAEELIKEREGLLDELEEASHGVDNDSEDIFNKSEKMFEARGIYLSGPILEVDDDGRGWREGIIEDWGEEFKFRNPLDNYDPDEVEILQKPSQYDPDSEKEQILPCEYIAEDKFEICRSQCVFLGLPHEITRGSSMEAMYAYMRGIPYFLWLQDGQEESGWIQDHAEFVSDDRDEVMEAIRDHLKNYE